MKPNNEAAEAMAIYGAKSVAEWQLLTVLGIPETASRELLAKAENSLSQLAKLTIQEISQIKGIGMSKASAIVAAIELGRRRQTEPARTDKKQITQSSCIYELVHPMLRDYTQEAFWIVLLDRRSRVIKTYEIHVGGLSAMVVDPKVIFHKALQNLASSVILIHNHPSGSPSPSTEDIRLTEKIKLAGTYIDIKVLDHIIIGDGCYYSFADEGKI